MVWGFERLGLVEGNLTPETTNPTNQPLHHPFQTPLPPPPTNKLSVSTPERQLPCWFMGEQGEAEYRSRREPQLSSQCPGGQSSSPSALTANQSCSGLEGCQSPQSAGPWRVLVEGFFFGVMESQVPILGVDLQTRSANNGPLSQSCRVPIAASLNCGEKERLIDRRLVDMCEEPSSDHPALFSRPNSSWLEWNS